MPLTRIKTKGLGDAVAPRVNIVDTGTEGTRVAIGTTAQRGSSQGQFRFNTTTGLGEYYDGSAFKAIDAPPTVQSISPTTEDGANANIVITGSGFASGATVKFIGNDGTEYNSPSVTFNSTTQLTATTPAVALSASNEPYDIKVTNTSGLANTLADALDAGGVPAWTTSSGNLGTLYEGQTASFTVVATDPDSTAVTYSTSDSLPGGLSLNTSTGAITGTASAVSSDTTTSFTIGAVSGADTTNRTFNIIVKDDGIMASAEAWFDPSDSRSWSGSGSSMTNLGNTGGSTTNLDLNGTSVVTNGGVTYIDFNSLGNGSNIPYFTLGNVSGDIQNYTVAFFAKHLTSSTDGVTFHYGNFTSNQAIGANYSTSNSTMNHYNYGNDSVFPGLALNTWQFFVLRKVSNTKQVWINNDEKTANSATNNTTSLPSNATAFYGSRGGGNVYDNGSTDLGMLAVWPTNISNTDIAYIWNRYKGDYGLS
tara:strand:- start:44 stop:1480 length:1437 start_codon:yes stop_codon:yes gene_type:complete